MQSENSIFFFLDSNQLIHSLPFSLECRNTPICQTLSVEHWYEWNHRSLAFIRSPLSLSLYSFSLSLIGHSARHLSDRFASSFTNNLESAWIIKQETRRESAAATVTIIIIQQQSLCNDSNGSHKLKGCHKQLQESHSVERTGYFGSVHLDWLRSVCLSSLSLSLFLIIYLPFLILHRLFRFNPTKTQTFSSIFFKQDPKSTSSLRFGI